MTTTFRIEAIPPATLSQIRSAGRDEAGNPLRVRVDDEGGSPLRCCLRDTVPGERVFLIAYTPPGVAGPYAERGPVFVHEAACVGYPDVHHYPAGLGHRRQIVRGYDHSGNMATATVVADGQEAEQELASVLGRPDIHVAHVRNVAAGCYNFAVWPAR
jgi:hypothetical protein